MKRKFIVGLVSGLIYSVAAEAGTTSCSDAEQKIKFTSKFSTGGQPREPETELSLGGKVVYRRGKDEVKEASYEFDTESNTALSSGSDYAIKLNIKFSDKEKNVSEFVICKDMRGALTRP